MGGSRGGGSCNARDWAGSFLSSGMLMSGRLSMLQLLSRPLLSASDPSWPSQLPDLFPNHTLLWFDVFHCCIELRLEVRKSSWVKSLMCRI